jgi:hypothetical protein
VKRPVWLRLLLPERVLSPLGLLTRAGVLVLAFLVLHACGLREYTTLVTGTAPGGGRVTESAVMLAIAYVAGYAGAVAAAPIMALAALLWAAGLLLLGRERPAGPAQS